MAGIRGHADLDPVRQHARPARHRRSIAARLANHRGRFAGNRRFVDRRDAFDDFAVGGNELAGADENHIVLPQRCRRHFFIWRPIRAGPDRWADESLRDALRARLAQSVGLRLAPPFSHRFGEVREQHREPQPEGDLDFEPQTRPASRHVAQQCDRGERAADLDDEHHGVSGHGPRMQLADHIARRAAHDAGVPDGQLFCVRHQNTCP